MDYTPIDLLEIIHYELSVAVISDFLKINYEYERFYDESVLKLLWSLLLKRNNGMRSILIC